MTEYGDLNGFAGIFWNSGAPAPVSDGGGREANGRGQRLLAPHEKTGRIEGFNRGSHHTGLSGSDAGDIKAGFIPCQQGGLNYALRTLPYMGNNQPKPDAHAFSLRLNEALNGISQCPPLRSGRGAWLAKLLKVSPPSATAWLHGDYMPTPGRVRTIAERAGVSYDWLYFGKGAPGETENNSRVGTLSQTERLNHATLTQAKFWVQAEEAAAGRQYPHDELVDQVIAVYELMLEGGGNLTHEQRRARMAAIRPAPRSTGGNVGAGTGNEGGSPARRKRG